MTDETTPTFVPIDLSPELQRQSEIKDLLWMREHDSTPKYEIKNVMLEMSIRVQQYVGQFKSHSFDFLILQTLQDFNKHILIKQNKEPINKLEPVALLRDGFKMIYVNPAIVRSDYQQGGVMLFINNLNDAIEPDRPIAEDIDLDGNQVITPNEDDIPF